MKAEGRVETEAEQLLTAVYRSATGLNLSRLELFSKMGSPQDGPDSLSKASAQELSQLAQERVRGVPLQYLTGSQWFHDHEYEVSPAVLIPRPETEVLLDALIKELAEAQISPQLGLEIGLGSGILSIELLSHFPDLRITASELTEGACAVAKRNAEKILGFGPRGADRLTLVRPENSNEVLEAFEKKAVRTEFSAALISPADFILSNPPYLAKESEVDTDVLLFEPHEALFAPEGDPLYFYRNIINRGREFLKPSGFVFVELPHERAQLILQAFLEKGWFAKTLPDLTGRDRVLVARIIPLGRLING